MTLFSALSALDSEYFWPRSGTGGCKEESNPQSKTLEAALSRSSVEAARSKREAASDSEARRILKLESELTRVRAEAASCQQQIEREKTSQAAKAAKHMEEMSAGLMST